MDDSELADIKAAIMDQWRSMAGMGAMFVSSILFGVFIQPFYNFEEMRAFGEEGTTEAGNILFELFMIFLFTIAVIWLARKGKEAVIKTIVFLALGYSLLLAIMPVLAILDYLLGLNSGPTLFSLICLGVAGGMMYTLHRYPLIILFMVLAAIYDHWAVNGSKHMLELADTMIDLKLPVLLVAPKDTSYTFLKQDGDIREGTEPRPQAPPDGAEMGMAKPKQRDALFMGLGDVIFPGMLVISSITFLPEIGPVVFDFWGDPSKPVHLGPMLVGMGTLFGGLLGYAALMTQVARGKPQAGLPLLNGGSILGYLVSGAIAIGVENLWQDITF